MGVNMTALADDLAAESAVTRALVAGLDEAAWHLATPAAGWDIADQITHLAYFDEVTVQSAVAPEEFMAERADHEASGGVSPDDIAAGFRDLTAAQLLAWFDTARAQLIDTFSGLDPATRLPWFGPAMSAASALTARLMETWAHAQDIADALGVSREPPSPAGPRASSSAVHGNPAPSAPVRVELIPPSGPDVTWTWGPEDAEDRVTGPAPGFCLLVTQRRHRGDVDLKIEGPAAEEWMVIAQAFAGGAGPGRPAVGRE